MAGVHPCRGRGAVAGRRAADHTVVSHTVASLPRRRYCRVAPLQPCHATTVGLHLRFSHGPLNLGDGPAPLLSLPPRRRPALPRLCLGIAQLPSRAVEWAVQPAH